MVDPLIGATEKPASIPGPGTRARAGLHPARRPALRGQLRPGPDRCLQLHVRQGQDGALAVQGPAAAPGYRPFNTQTLNGNIFVAYDKADPATGRQAVGRGLGVVGASPQRPVGPAARHGDQRRHRRAVVHRGHQPRAERPARRPAPLIRRTPPVSPIPVTSGPGTLVVPGPRHDYEVAWRV